MFQILALFILSGTIGHTLQVLIDLIYCV